MVFLLGNLTRNNQKDSILLDWENLLYCLHCAAANTSTSI